MRFSKHHYALELASLGNKVYYINPPEISCKGVEIKGAEETENLKIVTYKPVYRGKRFLPAFVFKQLLKEQVKILLKETGVTPDVVWCFDPYRFGNLNWFKAKVKIFFLADLLALDYLPGEAETADFSLALSESRINQLKRGHRPVFFINHGLSNYYAVRAKSRLAELMRSSEIIPEKITAGYIGNLLMEAPDRATMKTIIERHPEINFIFWGQYERQGQLVAFNNDSVFEFIDFLKKQPNVVLKGPVHPEVLSREITGVDLLWVCWKLNVSKMWDGSNPHKILEYLSTGKPLVTHHMDVYKDSDLVDMMPGDDNTGFPDLFDRVVERVSKGEKTELQRKRIEFALKNTYLEQIHRVENIINKKAN
ncbi:hypothetical protein [Pollutibacter soli]|uniref:hypothetical protein n=1 Tax=Pollutibacter soli TaxID=3034157 RepID=UPI003013AAB9